MEKKFIAEIQEKNFTDELNRHYLELGCKVEFKENSVEIWYIPEMETAA